MPISPLLLANSRFTSFLYIKEPLPQFNRTTIVSIVYIIMYNWFNFFEYSTQYRVLSPVVLCLFVSVCFVVIAIHCVGEGFSMCILISLWLIRRDSILIEFVLSHVFSTWFFLYPSFSQHCLSHMRWSWMNAIYSVVRWFRHFTAPFICLIHKNYTHALVYVCVWAEFPRNNLSS